MPSRTRSRCPALLLAAAVVLLPAVPTAAQPPSPLELARGLREHGHTELALEYLKELETQPLAPDDKAALGLERAKALLDASEDEADEGTRVGLIALAKEGLNAFLIAAPNHPRKVEGLLATAKLLSLDAREQLNRARRIDIPPAAEGNDKERDAAQLKQKDEATKARPLFELSSKRYAEATELLRAKLAETPDGSAKKALEREVIETELATGITQFNTAETFMPVTRQTVADQEKRNKYLEQAKETFGKLDKGGANNRTVWTARAWIAEVTYELNDFNVAAQQVAAILKANVVEAESGKRLARFFQLRRNYLAALGSGEAPKVSASERDLFAWLQQYGGGAKPTPEVYAVRYYRARSLQLLAESTIKPKEGIGATARNQLVEAERLYRGLSQSEHDYTARATRNRMTVVRRLLGEADQPAHTYDTFEKAQMASLIQLSKMAAEADPDKAQAIRMSAIVLLERARELITPADSPADVTDVLLKLIYYYQQAGMPHKAAVLGEHVSRTMPKMSGGKAPVAGLLGLSGYTTASRQLRPDPTASEDDIKAVAELKKTDRQRAVALAKFLDEKYPNDNATDAARHLLASLLSEEEKYQDAFDAILKVRPSFAGISDVRRLEGYLAAQLVAKNSPLDAEKKVEVFNRAKIDLAKAVKPAPVALEKDVRGYVETRCRLATLMLSQGRVDPKAEAARPGAGQALEIADEVLAAIPTFDVLMTGAGPARKPNLDGMELLLQAQDARARALYLRAIGLINAGKADEAAQSLEPAIAEINNTGSAVTAEMKAWKGEGDDAAQQDKILRLAAAVDKTRIEVLLAGFRLRVTQGKDCEIMLALIERVGGTIEDNLPTLQALGFETAAKMIAAKKEGKADQAKALGVGLGILLKKLQTVPSLSVQQLLFIGQMLVTVGEFEAGIAALKKVPAPEYKEWRTAPPDKLKARRAELSKQMTDIEAQALKALPEEDRKRADADPEGRADVVAKKVIPALQSPQKEAYLAAQKERAEVEKKIEALPRGLEAVFAGQMNHYAMAQLGIAKGLREDKRFQAAEAMLNEIVGTPDKPGWGSNRPQFRKELAAVFEDRAATVPDVKVAGPEWGRALQVWQGLFGTARARLQKLPPLPKLPDNATDDQKKEWQEKADARKVEERALKNAFADAFFDVQRCSVKANLQLRAAPNLKDKLQKSQEDAAKTFFDIEKQLPKLEDWDVEVQHRYVNLLNETPAMMAEYKKLGGKVFLEKKPLDP